MSNILDKLNEAKFFFQQLNKTPIDRTYFQNYLSAFLSSFRSITFVMLKKHSKNKNFKEWYSKINNELKLNDRMELLINMRNISIHELTINPRAEIYVFIQERVDATDECSCEIIHADGIVEKSNYKDFKIKELTQEPIIDIEKTNDKCLWYFNEYPESDILTICKDCLVIIENAVTEYELKFI